MRIYIAYKLSKLPDNEKQALRPKLEAISAELTRLGNETFIMGRDAQSWTKEHTSSIRTMSLILKHLNSYDAVLAFIDSDVASLGMSFEIFYGKLIGKKVIYLVNSELKNSVKSLIANETIIYNDMSDLSVKLAQRFSR